MNKPVTRSPGPLLGAETQPVPMRGLPTCALVAYDFSEEAERAMHVALQLMHGRVRHGLQVVHVCTDVDPHAVWLANNDRLRTRLIERVRTRLDLVHHEPQWEDIPIHIAWGRAADEIALLADSLAADLIIVGRKRNRRLKRLLFGSMVEELVRRAPCPVLVARSPRTALRWHPPQAA